MTKKNKITIIILAVVLVLTGTFAVLSLNSGFLGKFFGGSSKSQQLSAVLVSDFTSDYPLVQTQQKDLFYEAYPDGTIKFFSFADGTFTEYSGNVEKKDIKVSCSRQKIPVTLYYTDTDAGMVGYGLFTAQQNSDIEFFSYVFVRAMTCPESYRSLARTDDIVLVDMDGNDAYKTEKTYSDIYSFDKKSGNTVKILSERDRLIQQDGTFREDWAVFTDTSLNEMTKYDLFASARNHDTAVDNKEYDIMSVENSKAYNKNSTVTVSSSPSYNIWFDSDTYYCLASTDNGFDLIKDGDKDSPLASFSGNFKSDFYTSGDWIYDIAKTEFTNALTGNAIGFSAISFKNIAGVTANPSGNKFAVFGSDSSKYMVLLDGEKKSSVNITDANLYDSGIGNFCFIDDSTVLVSTYDSAKQAVNHICKF